LIEERELKTHINRNVFIQKECLYNLRCSDPYTNITVSDKHRQMQSCVIK